MPLIEESQFVRMKANGLLLNSKCFSSAISTSLKPLSPSINVKLKCPGPNRAKYPASVTCSPPMPGWSTRNTLLYRSGLFLTCCVMSKNSVCLVHSLKSVTALALNPACFKNLLMKVLLPAPRHPKLYFYFSLHTKNLPKI